MEAIYDSGGRLDLAVSLQDDMARDKSGRVYLDQFCDDHGIDLVKVRNINSPEAIDAIRAHELGWLFIIGWSQIAREALLSTPELGVIGMHPTLLPTGRGRAAIPWAILKDLDATGVTMFKLDMGVDTGPIIAQKIIPLSADADATSLYRAVEEAHVELMRDAFPKLCDGLLELQPQDDSRATEWPGRTPEDGRMQMDGSVHEADRLVRATTRPYPGAFVDLPPGRLIVWRAHVTSAAGCSEARDANPPVIVFSDGALVAEEWEWRDHE